MIFDHVDKTIKVVANADLPTPDGATAAYRDACRRIDAIVDTVCSSRRFRQLGEIDPRRR